MDEPKAEMKVYNVPSALAFAGLLIAGVALLVVSAFKHDASLTEYGILCIGGAVAIAVPTPYRPDR